MTARLRLGAAMVAVSTLASAAVSQPTRSPTKARPSTAQAGAAPAPSPPTVAPGGPAALRQKVLDLIRRQRYEDAHNLCALTIRTRPEDALAYFMMGRTHEPWKREVRWMLDLPDQAEPIPSQALAERTRSHPSYSYDQRHAVLAGGAYEKAVELQPDNLEYRAALTLFWLDAENTSRVVELLEWFRKNPRRPGVPEVLKTMADRYHERVRYEREANVLEILHEALPGNTDLALAYAAALLRSARPQEAARFLEGLVKGDSASAAVLEQLADTYLLMDDFEAARPHLEKLYESDLGNPQIAWKLAMLDLGTGSRDAPLSLERFFIIHDSSERKVADQPLAQIEAMRALLERRPPPTGADWLARAREAAGKGLTVPAWTSLRLARRSGADPLETARLGRDIHRALYFLERELAAIEECRRLARGRPGGAGLLDGPGAWFELGKHYFHWHLNRAACKVWEEAQAKGMANAASAYHLGRAYEEQALFDRAYAQFLKAAAMKESSQFVGKAQRKLAQPRYRARPGNPYASTAPGDAPAPASTAAPPTEAHHHR